jgi:hypothetical protein
MLVYKWHLEPLLGNDREITTYTTTILRIGTDSLATGRLGAGSLGTDSLATGRLGAGSLGAYSLATGRLGAGSLGTDSLRTYSLATDFCPKQKLTGNIY